MTLPSSGGTHIHVSRTQFQTHGLLLEADRFGIGDALMIEFGEQDGAMSHNIALIIGREEAVAHMRRFIYRRVRITIEPVEE